MFLRGAGLFALKEEIVLKLAVVGSTGEEMKIVNETCKIFRGPDISVWPITNAVRILLKHRELN